MKTSDRLKTLTRASCGIIILCAGGCLYRLASVGETSLHSVAFGFSASRLGMLGVLLLAGLAALIGCLDPGGRVSAAVDALSKKSSVRILTAALFFAASLGWILCNFLVEERFIPYARRLEPLLTFAMALGAVGTLLFAVLRAPRQQPDAGRKSFYRTALIYFLIGCGIYGFMRLTGLGIVPDEMDWQPTGMVIRYWEIALAAWLALLLGTLMYHFRPRGLTLILFLLIWAGSAVLWVSVPTMDALKGSYFMAITAPDYLPFPASDAANFGLWAESVRAGLGFKTAIAYRQFLCVVIAFFETLTNGDILKAIDCMTVVQALLPACMYLLGKRLHSHGTGILAAGLAALREYNTILLGPYFMVSNSKMWLSDLPSALCLLAAVTAAVAWFRQPRSVLRMILAGGLMGLCVTVRSQFIVLTFFPALFYLIERHPSLPLRKKLPYALGFMAAVLLVIAPWFIRSKIITGDFILDDPGVHSTELARRWSDDVTNQVVRNEGESDAEYAARNKQHMIDFVLEKPGYVIGFIASHFTANELVGLSALPWGTDPSLTTRDFANTDFHDMDSRLLKPSSLPSLFGFLALVAFGMAAAWRRTGWAGLLPFFMGSLYLGSTAAARYSGWRFALPGDWFWYFYFALGCGELAVRLAVRLGASREQLLSVSPVQNEEPARQSAAVIPLVLLFAVLGAAPALCGEVIPQQLYDRSSEENAAALRAEAERLPAEVEQLLENPNLSVISGRVIYPRFFGRNQGLASGHPWIAYRSRNFARLGFVLLNETNYDVLLPLCDEPAFIQNGAEAYVIGTAETDGFFRAEALVLFEESGAAPRVIYADREEFYNEPK